MHTSQKTQITQAAVDRVYGLLEGEENFELKLRIAISGGGCNGFQYQFTFEEASLADDIIIDASKDANPDEGITVIIDPISNMYLSGATVDYKMDAAGERFVIDNPHAKTTCGCGSSFST